MAQSKDEPLAQRLTSQKVEVEESSESGSSPDTSLNTEPLKSPNINEEPVTAHSHLSDRPLPRNILHEPTLDLFNQMIVNDRYNFLGRTGLRVSRICLGTMNFGFIDSSMGIRPGQVNEVEAHKILDRFVELGGNFIETADFYPWFGSNAGDSERIIGNWLSKQVRERIILMTKIRMPADLQNVNSSGLSRNHIIQSVNKCLERLQTSYIDVLQLIGWDDSVSVHDTVRNLDELIVQGKISYVGACDIKGWQLQKFIDAAKIMNVHKCVLYEGEYNLLTRGCEWEIMEVCRSEKIAFLPYAPLKYGYLTNKYSSSSTNPIAGSRIEAASASRPNMAAMAESFNEMINNPNYAAILNTCSKIAKRFKHITTSQIAILWTLQKGITTSAVVGVENIGELEENMEIITGNYVLTHNEMHSLNLASNVRVHYPYNVNLSPIAGQKMIMAGRLDSFEQMSLLKNRNQFYEPYSYQQQQQQEISTGNINLQQQSGQKTRQNK